MERECTSYVQDGGAQRAPRQGRETTAVAAIQTSATRANAIILG